MRWLSLAYDPTPGGTTYDNVNEDRIPVPDPTIWVPATTGTASAGSNNIDRRNEVRGRRGDSAPTSFSAAPTGSFECRAYPAIVKPIVAAALGGIGDPTGTTPTITTPVTPLQSNPVNTLVMHLLREEQYEIVAGLAVNSFELTFAADGEGMVRLNDGQGLYFDLVDPLPRDLPEADYSEATGETFKLRDLEAFEGDGSGVKIDCLSNFTLTFNNNLISDFQSRYCAGENVRSYDYDSNTYKVWFPGRHKLSSQDITGTMGFADVRPDQELRRILAHAEKFRATVTAGDEIMEITLFKQVFTGGGADPLVKDGDIRGSYEYGGFLDDATNEDIEISFTAPDALDPWAAS